LSSGGTAAARSARERHIPLRMHLLYSTLLDAVSVSRQHPGRTVKQLWSWTPAHPTGAERVGRLESQWFVVDGRRLHVRVSVESAPADALAVVLVYGLGVASAYMVPTAVRLARKYRVYAPDLPGFGHSDKPPRTLDIPELADALVAWMDTAGLGRVALIGNSLGCQIIVDFAIRYHARVEKLVLQGPTMDRYARTSRQQLGRGLLDVLREHPSQPLVQTRDYGKFGLRRSLRTFQFAVRDRIKDKLPLVQVPTLVVRGERDPIVSQRRAEEVTQLLPSGRLVVIPGAPHTLNYSTPQAFVRVLRPFLEGAGSEETI
jgi:2-hydroxy-6-oxonona-2,4-dienedioate hydrolase